MIPRYRYILSMIKKSFVFKRLGNCLLCMYRRLFDRLLENLQPDWWLKKSHHTKQVGAAVYCASCNHISTIRHTYTHFTKLATHSKITTTCNTGHDESHYHIWNCMADYYDHFNKTSSTNDISCNQWALKTPLSSIRTSCWFVDEGFICHLSAPLGEWKTNPLLVPSRLSVCSTPAANRS